MKHKNTIIDHKTYTQNMYTFIIEFRGGTYISQVKTKHLLTAITKWAHGLNPKVIKHFGSAAKKELLEALPEIKPSPIAGVINVWFFYYTLRSGFFGVNIIKTSVESK